MCLICKFCGSRNVKTIGGDGGDPFDRRPQKTVCGDCGRLLLDEKDISNELYEVALRQTEENNRDN